jgi:Flp pilus assembly protein TadG
MPSSAASTTSLRNVLRRFRRNRRGSTAVEFAMVAPMFLALLYAVLETAMVFFAGQALETMTQDSARTIMTGQSQTAGYNASQFLNQVACKQIVIFFNCANLYVDVQSYPTFANINISSQIDSSGNFVTSNLGYNPGGPSQIVVVRLFYQWPLVVTGLGYNISNLAGSKRLLAATAAFQTEPY